MTDTPLSPPPHRPRWRRARRGVLAGLLAFVAAQVALTAAAEANPAVRDPAYGDKLTTLRARLAAAGPDRPPLVVMLGSSRTLLGFHAKRAEETCGVVAFNFGTPASGPITHLVYLNRLLDAGIVPDLLIVEVLPPLLADGPGGPIEQQFLPGERLCGNELETVERCGFDPATVRTAWRESAALPWGKLRFQVVGRVAPSWLPWNLRYDWSRGTDANGWTTPPRQSVTADERADHVAKVRDEYAATLAALEPDGRPLAALRTLTALCRERGIPVRIVLMPEAPSFRTMEPEGLSDRVRAAVEGVGEPLTDARVWLAEDDFYDGHHPFTAGAERFTDKLCETTIRPWLATGGRRR